MAQETTKQSLILCVGEKCSSKFPGLVFSSIGNTVSVSFFFKPARYFANHSSRSDKLFKISSFFGARWRKIILAILATLVILAILAISAT